MLNILFALVFFGFGIALGGYLFSDTQPRSFFMVRDCQEHCIDEQELWGLLTSIGLQKLPAFIPSVVRETDKTIVVRHPIPQSEIHYVVIPKKDIKSIGDISDQDSQYIIDAFLVISSIIREEGLTHYKVITNGPGYQTVGYLHFHIVSLTP